MAGMGRRTRGQGGGKGTLDTSGFPYLKVQVPLSPGASHGGQRALNPGDSHPTCTGVNDLLPWES